MERTSEVAGVGGGAKDHVVKRVWYGVGKVVESQSPEAWGSRIVAITEKIKPNLSPEKQKWMNDHRDEIRSAANYAGVAITTAEIAAAVAIGSKTIQLIKIQRELARARRMIQYVRLDKHIPATPITVALAGTYALKPEIANAVYQSYFAGPQDTYELYASLERKWKKGVRIGASGSPRVRIRMGSEKHRRITHQMADRIRPRIPYRSTRWMRNHINGTLVTLSELMQDQDVRTLVARSLAESKGSALHPNFRRLFEYAHRTAFGRQDMKGREHDVGRVWDFWTKEFQHSGLDNIRKQSSRVFGIPKKSPDLALAHVRHYVDRLPGGLRPLENSFRIDVPVSGHMPHDVRTRLPSVTVRLRTAKILKNYADKHLLWLKDNRDFSGIKKSWIAVVAKDFVKDVKWRRPEIAMQFSIANRTLEYGDQKHARMLAVLLDEAWTRRSTPHIQEWATKMQHALRAGRRSEARTYGLQLLSHVYKQSPLVQKHTNAHSYYEIRDLMGELYGVWADKLKGLGLNFLFEPDHAQKTNKFAIIVEHVQRLYR